MLYRPDKHELRLRKALLKLKADNISPARLRGELYRAVDGTADNSISVSALGKFVNDKRKNVKYRAVGALSALYSFLLAHERYREYFEPEEPEPPAKPDVIQQSVEQALTGALGQLLLSESTVEHRTMKTIKAGFPGRFVMYRADLRPYAFKIPSPPERYRASAVTITLSDGAICIEEMQDYPAGRDYDALSLRTTGILVPYGRFVMFVMRALVKESFRLGVIDRAYSFIAGEGLGWFSGDILVASEADLFPSTRFICVRDDGSLKTGLIYLSEIPHFEAQAYLRDVHKKARVHYEIAELVIKS